MSKRLTKKEQGPTVAFRVDSDLRKFYEKKAAREKRRLSEVLRTALESHAASLQNADRPAA